MEQDYAELPLDPSGFPIPKLRARPRKAPVGGVRLLRGREAWRVLRRALLPMYTNRLIYDEVRPPSNIYYRVYRRDGEYAVFLLYEWPFQAIPPHKYDYEPVIVFLDRDLNVKSVYTDGFHYYIHGFRAPPVAPGEPHILVSTPWRSMEVKWSEPGRGDVMIYPVDEVEGTPAPTRITYLSDKRLEELRSRAVNPLTVNERLIRNPWSVAKARHWATYGEPGPEYLVSDLAKDYGLHRYDVLLARLKLVIKQVADAALALLQALAGKLGLTRGERRGEELETA